MIEQIYIFFRRNRESPEYIFSKVFSCAGFAGMKICFGWDETEFLPVSFFLEKGSRNAVWRSENFIYLCREKR